jgi:hypothetical protein
MTKTLIVFMAIVIGAVLAGCPAFPPEESICVKYQPEEYSWICEVAGSRGYTPEDLEGIVLDLIALRAIMDEDWDQTKTDKVVAYTRKLDQYVENPAMTFTELIKIIELDSQRSALLMSIISRRLPWFKNGMVIPVKDRYMIHVHLKHIREMFGVYDPEPGSQKL